MDLLTLLAKTLLLRCYVFLFLALALYIAVLLMGRARALLFFGITWFIAFLCEFLSTRTGIPFGWYFYTGATRGQELYISNIPLMDSLSFSFLLFCSYCLSITLISPSRGRGLRMSIAYDPTIRPSRSALVLAVVFFVLIDVVIDPVALRGEHWFLGKIYYYPEPGVHFGVPLANYGGWAVVGVMALGLYQRLNRRLPVQPGAAGGRESSENERKNGRLLLLGCALYYAVLCFNLAVTFWIGERLIGVIGMMTYLPVSAMLLRKLGGQFHAGTMTGHSLPKP